MDENKFSNFIYLFIIYLIESFVYWNIFLFSFLLKIFFYRDKYLTSLIELPRRPFTFQLSRVYPARTRGGLGVTAPRGAMAASYGVCVHFQASSRGESINVMGYNPIPPHLFTLSATLRLSLGIFFNIWSRKREESLRGNTIPIIITFTWIFRSQKFLTI